MSGHNQLLVNYTRQCRNLPSRLPVFCHNKAPQLHGKFYQETSSVEHRREHMWSPWRQKQLLKEDKDKNTSISSLQATLVINPKQLNVKPAAHTWSDLQKIQSSSKKQPKSVFWLKLLLRPHFLQLLRAFESECKSGLQNSVSTCHSLSSTASPPVFLSLWGGSNTSLYNVEPVK